MIEKCCTKCQEVKALSRFSPAKRKRDGLDSWCKDCHNTNTKRLRLLDPQKTRAAQRRWALQTHYGITPERWDQMFAEQQGVCALCQTATLGDSRGHRLHVDHDASTGKVRSLLCGHCNTAIGKLNHDPALLRRAAEYLEAHRDLVS